MSADESPAQAPIRSPSLDPETSELERTDVVLEHCPKCDALLDVSDCSLLTETSCPSCGGIIRVLKQFHHFALMNELGRGGTGAVYRAFDESLERDVALKLLRREYFHNPEFLANGIRSGDHGFDQSPQCRKGVLGGLQKQLLLYRHGDH